MKIIFCLLVFCFNAVIGNSQILATKIIKKIKLPIAEPSDICFTTKYTFIIPSDDGKLFEIDSNGKIIKSTDKYGFDLEASCIVNDLIYLGDESYRTIYCLHQNNFTEVKKYVIAYNAGRNKGIEGICYDGKNLYACTEKKPALILRLDTICAVISMLNTESEFGIKEMSGITFYNNHLWILSDEERMIYEIDFTNKKVINQWRINILNPEGICFDNLGNCIIVSDNMATMYYINLIK